MSYCQSCADYERDIHLLKVQIQVADSAFNQLHDEVKELRAFKASALKVTTESTIAHLQR